MTPIVATLTVRVVARPHAEALSQVCRAPEERKVSGSTGGCETPAARALTGLAENRVTAVQHACHDHRMFLTAELTTCAGVPADALAVASAALAGARL